MQTTLEYRNPGTRNGHTLAQRMAVRERAYQAGAWGMLAAGVGASLFVPFIVASVVVSAQHRMAMGFGWTPVGFAEVFLVALAVVLPLGFWWERRTGGTWFEGEARAQGTTAGDFFACSSRGEWELRRTAASWAVIVEIALWGPRIIMNARERWRAKVPAAVMQEASAIVHHLRKFDGGVEVKDLPAARPAAALRYLVSRDWVGVAKKGDRVWLLSDARKLLD